ncbi:MAG: YdiY family protein [Steroidobacteraceae bacterium]
MSTIRIIAATLLALAPAVSSWADDAPAPPPPQGVWMGKGQFGFLDSKGNSDAESINGNIDLLRYDGLWKNEFYLGGLYGENSGIVAAERWETRGQTSYTLSGDLFAFGALRYEHDLFDGFEYQESLSGGLGYKLINTDDTKFTAQVGAGYKRLRPEIIEKDSSGEVISRTPLEAEGDAIGTLGLDFSHAFNKATTLTNKFLMEAGSSNILLTDALALTVKMSTKLALSVGYAVSDNTKPPAPLKRVDTVTTVNLVFSF